jgi:hypothetical protein
LPIVDVNGRKEDRPRIPAWQAKDPRGRYVLDGAGEAAHRRDLIPWSSASILLGGIENSRKEFCAQMLASFAVSARTRFLSK